MSESEGWRSSFRYGMVSEDDNESEERLSGVEREFCDMILTEGLNSDWDGERKSGEKGQ